MTYNKEMCNERADRDAKRRTREEQIRELIISFDEYEHTPVDMPGYAHKMILEAEIRAIATERERCATLVDHYARDCMDGLIGNLFRSASSAIREGGAHG